ncbi:Centrosomal protein of 104 kDa, partial [Oryzias melastigma]
VAEAFSRTWYQREQALLAVHNKLLEATSTSSKEELRNMIRAAGLLTRRALLDKVTLVFYASLKLLRLILIYIIPDVGLGRAEAAHCLQQTFPHLLQRTGDAAGRPRAAAIAFIQPGFSFSPAPPSAVLSLSAWPPRLARSRLKLLEKLLAELGTEIFPLEAVIRDLEKGGIQLDDEEVRSLQEQLAGLKEMTGGGAESPRHPEGQQQVTKDPPKAAKAASGLTKGGKKRGGVNTQQPVRHLDLEILCIFFCEEDESFTEDGLDLHYWKHCPMLHRCHECGQVVEVSGLSRHLLDECESRSGFRPCPRCSQALPAEDLTPHLQGSFCHPSRGGNHCPLCHSSFLPGEEEVACLYIYTDITPDALVSILLSPNDIIRHIVRLCAGRADTLKPWCSAGARVVPVDRSRLPFLVPVNTKPTQGKH